MGRRPILNFLRKILHMLNYVLLSRTTCIFALFFIALRVKPPFFFLAAAMINDFWFFIYNNDFFQNVRGFLINNCLSPVGTMPTVYRLYADYMPYVCRLYAVSLPSACHPSSIDTP